jgi:hypothetical protein
MKRKIALVVAILAVALPAAAEWVKVSEIVTSTFYIDPATIRKDGNLPRVWMLQNLNQRHKDGEMSRRVLAVYDCKEEKTRNLSISEHSGPMATGETLRTVHSPGEWSYIAPNTPGSDIHRIVCSK